RRHLSVSAPSTPLPPYLSRPAIFFFYLFFFFNDPAPTEIYTLSLHDALPIFHRARVLERALRLGRAPGDAERLPGQARQPMDGRSEEHTSELQSLTNLVCRLLLEKKKKRKLINSTH